MSTTEYKLRPESIMVFAEDTGWSPHDGWRVEYKHNGKWRHLVLIQSRPPNPAQMAEILEVAEARKR